MYVCYVMQHSLILVDQAGEQLTRTPLAHLLLNGSDRITDPGDIGKRKMSFLGTRIVLTTLTDAPHYPTNIDKHHGKPIPTQTYQGKREAPKPPQGKQAQTNRKRGTRIPAQIPNRIPASSDPR